MLKPFDSGWKDIHIFSLAFNPQQSLPPGAGSCQEPGVS